MKKELLNEITQNCTFYEKIIVKLFRKLFLKIYHKMRVKIVNNFLE